MRLVLASWLLLVLAKLSVPLSARIAGLHILIKSTSSIAQSVILTKLTSPMKMLKKRVLTFLLFTVSLTFPSLIHSLGAKCAANAPSVQQTQVGNGYPPKFMVEVQNNCPMCPVINIHLKCGSFPQALVNPRLLKVVAPDDCVVNGGLPLSPLQKISFNYSHQKYLMQPSSWSFQCE
ncbi:hypothetical protein SADUNF_Sadunf02G0185200 [Salix dunnii]|uniref:Uncharacterized protein n=1 Tax=Salix dunnii TaxID=1413687 RepID=A0A835THV8_9ROSI|nr:hypothetical protein SADUNF_Sadunf02G0185200 [Salix dunnii]